MANTEQRRRGPFSFLLDTGILIAGLLRGLAGKGRSAQARLGPGDELAELELQKSPTPSAANPWAEAEREIAARTFPAHFTIRPHWNEPQPASIPALTYAPATMALGIVIFALGLITRWYVALVGGVIFARAIWMWVGDLTDERSDRNFDGL